MVQSKKVSLCYVVEGKEYIIGASDENICIEIKDILESSSQQEKMMIIENKSEKEVFLKYAVLHSMESLEGLELGEGPYRVYRSGRHKNDMPGIFTLGSGDESLKDVLGAMTESGDKTDAESNHYQVISDHLTIITGSEKSFFVEFTGGRKQLFETVLTLNEDYQLEKLEAKVIFNVILPTGRKMESEELRLICTPDTDGEIERFAVNKSAKYGSRCGKRPSVFCTWYYYGLTVSYQDVKTNLQIMKEKRLPFDVFQVDEGWEITLGEWEPNGKFPLPMKQVAEEIKAAGYRPGIWTSPFVAHETASIWKLHPEWRLKDKEGEPCLFPMNDTVYHVLDITNPATYGYFMELYRKLTFEWGYTYHKLDFTRAAVIYEDADFYDKTVSLAECYYKAVCAIREGMGEEAYFLMCGGLYDPIVGLVDAQRTGSDVLSMWSSNINKGGKTAPYTIKQSVLRYYMNHWWDNDPDALMIRKNEMMERGLRLTYGLLNDEEVKTSVINQFMGGGIMCATEPLDKISEDRLSEYRRILPVLSRQVKAVKLMKSGRFPEMMDVYIEAIDAHYICVINWDDENALKATFSLKEVLPDYVMKDRKYMVCDYYSRKYRFDVVTEEILEFDEIRPHGANVYKVTAMSNHPQVVESTGHYSMGGEFEKLEFVNNKLHYVVNNGFDCMIEYKIWLPDGRTVTLEIPKGKSEGTI